jgi:hypothetical protein
MRSILVSLVLIAAAVAHADYDLLVTQTPSGSNPPPYFGVLRFNIDGAGNAAPLPGIVAADVVDPAGLALSSTGELFVGNRNGNDVHPGGGSVSRFLYNAGTDSYIPNGSFAVGATGTHGLNFSPTTGELFTANVNGPVSRFIVTGGGATPNGSMNSGPARDVLISADGTRAYVTQGVNGNVLVFDVASGTQITTFAVPGAGALHFGSWRGSDLFLADYTSGSVYDMTFDGAGNPIGATFAANSPSAISVGFSPNGMEMFVPGHTSGLIGRFLNVGGVWTPNSVINTGVNMGDIQIVEVSAVPEPASFAALGLGLLALKRRRTSA